MRDYSAYLVFVDSPKRTPAQNERARQRAIDRLHEFAEEAGDLNAAEFANVAEHVCDQRGSVLVAPHDVVPELAES